MEGLYERKRELIVREITNAAKPCEPAPLDKMANFLEFMAREVEEQMCFTRPMVSATLFAHHGTPLVHQMPFWQDVCDWHNRMTTKHNWLRDNKLPDLAILFESSMRTERGALRQAMAIAWNKRQPRLPASWTDDGVAFQVAFQLPANVLHLLAAKDGWFPNPGDTVEHDWLGTWTKAHVVGVDRDSRRIQFISGMDGTRYWDAVSSFRPAKRE